MAFDPKKITDAKEMTKLQEGFYLLVDSPTQGTRKFCTDAFIAPPEPIPPEPTPTYLYKWNFTKSTDPLIDEINGVVATYNNKQARLDEDGFHLINRNSNITFPLSFEVGKTYELILGEINSQVTQNNGKFFIQRTTTNRYDFFGLRKENNIYNWKWWIDYTFYDMNISTGDFSNSHLKFVIKNQLTEIYLNDTLIGSGNLPFNNYSYQEIRIGDSGGQGFFAATIKEFYIYDNE